MDQDQVDEAKVESNQEEEQSVSTEKTYTEKDLAGLKKNQRQLKSELIKAQEMLEKFKIEAEEQNRINSEKQGDYKSLYESVNKELEKTRSEHKEFVEMIKHKEEQYLLDSTVNSIADKLFGDRSKIIDKSEIRNKFKVIDLDGKKQIAVLDEHGEISTKTVSDIESEIRASEIFSPFIVSSNATGGGAKGSGSLNHQSGFKNLSAEEKINLGLGIKK